MNVWLDDLRNAPEGFDVHVKTAQEAINLLKSGHVEVISLDHDLGEGAGTGYDVACFIERHNIPVICHIHTQNVVGRRNMEMALRKAK